MSKLLAALAMFSVAAMGAKPLEIYFIDVEGGQSTLIVSPFGESLLVDTGWAGHGGRDADRILAAAKNAHVKRINYLLITHFHEDHVGGVYNLLQRLPVENFLDHGPSVEGDKKYPMNYSEGFAKGQHTVVKPGDHIDVKGLEVTVVAAAGKHIEQGGKPNPYCAGEARRAEDPSENAQSSGIVVEMGKFRFADLGDLSYDKNLDLVCPNSPLGKVDVWLISHHTGEELPKALVYSLHPRVAISNNGAKGGLPAAWQMVHSSPGLEDIWQLHFSYAGGKESNSSDPFLANLDENGSGSYLKVTAEADGAFSIYNARNKFLKNYPVR